MSTMYGLKTAFGQSTAAIAAVDDSGCGMERNPSACVL